MGNWTGAARTNYVKLKDPDAVRAYIARWAIDMVEEDGRFAFLSTDPDTGDWPTSNQLDEFFDVDEGICRHMEPGEILILMVAGHEAMRYCSGSATAFNHLGEYVGVSLNDIYELASKSFNVPLSSITTAAY